MLRFEDQKLINLNLRFRLEPLGTSGVFIVKKDNNKNIL